MCATKLSVSIPRIVFEAIFIVGRMAMATRYTGLNSFK